jgi:hypothetical protein
MNKEEMLSLVDEIAEGFGEKDEEMRRELDELRILDPKLGALMAKLFAVAADCVAYARSRKESKK